MTWSALLREGLRWQTIAGGVVVAAAIALVWTMT